MLDDLLQFFRGLWDGILLPYVVLSIANLATDGWESVMQLRETVVVLFCFMWGASHRSFPLTRSAVEAQRALLVPPHTTAGSNTQTPPRRAPYIGGSDTDTRAGSDGESTSPLPSAARAATPSTPDTEEREKEIRTFGEEDAADTEMPLLQRRLLLGRKGEIEVWLPGLPGRPLIPPLHTLRLSRSLHQLVSIVIGPIQQPTVATMPTRHPEPQWPPHFMRTVGGSCGVGGRDVGDPSTDDYSSSNSSAPSPHSLRHRGSPMPNASASSAAAGAVSGTRYRQASSVVYQRVSSRNLDFSSSRVAPHLIASITAHHVLSYPATRQKVLVMDLDETLCYVSTSTASMSGPPTFSEVIPTASGAELFHVWERPYARLFLTTAAKLFNLILFTSASRPYADTILQRIDPDHLLKVRLYRHDCRLVPRGVLRRMCSAAGMRNTGAGASTNRSGVGRGTGHGLQSGEDTPRGGVGVGGVSNASSMWGAANMPRNTSELHSSGAENSDAQRHTRHMVPTFNASTNGTAPMFSVPQMTVVDELHAALPPRARTVMNERTKVLVKDLRVLKVPPELLVMIDNTEECTLVNPENALIISPYIPSLVKAEGGGEKVTSTPAAVLAEGTSANMTDSCTGTGVGSGGKNGDPSASPLPTAGASSSEDSVLMGEDLAGNDAPDDEDDEVLLALLPMLECLLVVPDVRSILRLGKLY